MKEDSAGASLLDNISYLYCFYNPEEGLVYAQKALDLSRKIKWKMGIGRAYNDFGNNYLNQGMYPEALEALFKSLNLSEEIADKKVIAKSTCNIGIIYYYQGNYENAIQYQTLSLKSYREIGSSDGAFFTLGNLGSIYYAQKKYKEALKYMEQAMKIAVAQNDDRGVMMQLTNMASVYSDSGDTKTALMYYLRSLNLAKAQKDIQMTAIAEGNIGDNYLQMAIDSTQKYSSAEREQFLYLAVDYLKKGIIGCKEVNYNNGLLDFSKTLSKVYALQGNYQKALELFQQFTAAKDSTFSIANTEKMAHLETKRAIQLKDKDIKIAQLEVAKERNKRGFFLAGIAFLLGLLILVFRNYSKQRKSNYLIQKEKKKSDDLLLNILPLEVADELKATGTSRAKHYDNVSVLFTDFVDFTGMAESLSPEQLVAELHECFSAFDQIIERHGLEKIKTIGDAYMAVSGLPVADEMHACQAVQAAIEILEFVEARRNNPVTAKPGFRIRMGINSGSVVAGIVGEKKFAFDIWGDTVNIAARMEQHGEAGKINISETTYRFVKNNFYCHSRGMIEAKHKGAVAMYFVVSNRSAIS
ncbi:MAG: adenylate/guanylate cyclase domain-containing protein [Chitinophagaceae bacterium]